MEIKTKEEIGQGTAMTKEDFAALWKSIITHGKNLVIIADNTGTHL